MKNRKFTRQFACNGYPQESTVSELMNKYKGFESKIIHDDFKFKLYYIVITSIN